MTERHTRTTGVGNRNLERSVSMLNFVRLANFIIKGWSNSPPVDDSHCVNCFCPDSNEHAISPFGGSVFFLEFRVNAARVL